MAQTYTESPVISLDANGKPIEDMTGMPFAKPVQLGAKALSPIEQLNVIKEDLELRKRAEEQALTKSQMQELEKALACHQAGDYKVAIRMLKQLASQDITEAQFKLGVMYQKGQGIAQDHQVARRWFEKAALKEHVKAQYNLGMMYKDGLGGDADYRAAIMWWELAAKQGHVNAQYNLVVICKKYAEKGDPSAQHKLGRMYFRGAGVPFDRNEAFIWFKKAAEAYYPPALYWAGLCYENGFGTGSDISQAIKCFDKAAELGLSEANTKLRSLPGKLVREQTGKQSGKWLQG